MIPRSFMALLALGVGMSAAWADNEPVRDQIAIFDAAKAAGETGIAKKTKEVDARQAKVGEIVVSIVKGDDAVETRSKPAEEGDWVVRSRCPETGSTEILVKAGKFPTRYGEPQSQPDAEGFQQFKPLGSDMGYYIVPQDLGAFSFVAPWGENMIARPGDAIVQIPEDKSDTYRIAAAAFACTYEIVTPAKP